jgi:hypothetical protein
MVVEVLPDLQHVLPELPDLQQVFFEPSSAAVVGVAHVFATSVLIVVLVVPEVVIVLGAVEVVVVVVVVGVETVFAGSLST